MIFTSLFFTSCEDSLSNLSESSTQQITKRSISQQTIQIPHEDPKILNELFTQYQKEGLLHYRTARVIAYAEIYNGIDKLITSQEWMEYKYDKNKLELTKYPVVIYDYNNIPYLYEFGVIYDGRIVSTIATETKRVENGVISYIMKEKDYSFGYNLKRYISNKYPTEIYYSEQNEQFPRWKEEDNKLVELIDKPVFYTQKEAQKFWLEIIPEEEKKDYQTYLDSLWQARAERPFIIKDFWEKTDSLFKMTFDEWLDFRTFIQDEDDKNTSEEEPDPTIENDKKIADIIAEGMSGVSDDVYEIPRYKDKHLRLTHWNAYCGPAALAFVYRGLFSYYPYTNTANYLNLVGDNPATATKYFNDRGTYAYYDMSVSTDHCSSFSEAKDCYKEKSKDTDFGLSACFYNRCFDNFITCAYDMPMTIFGMNNGFKDATNKKYKVVSTIKPYVEIGNNNPVIIDICCHYVVGIARGKVKNRKYELVVDNGSTTGSNYAPYWMKQCKGLSFAVVKPNN